MLNMTSFEQPINQMQIYILFYNEPIISSQKCIGDLKIMTESANQRIQITFEGVKCQAKRKEETHFYRREETSKEILAETFGGFEEKHYLCRVDK